MKILAVYGSTAQESNSKVVVSILATAASAAGAELTHLNLLDADLPTMRIDHNFDEHPGVQEVRALTAAADGFILVSPEYHGCMSNWMKNYFDFHYHQFAGKLFAIASTTGGSLGTNCNNQMRLAVQHCHGWVLPYQAGVRQQEIVDGQIQEPRVLERLQRMGYDLVTYGQILQQSFQQERQRGQGFAGWYTP